MRLLSATSARMPGAGARRSRRLTDFVVHAPQHLRVLVRADELWLIALAAGIGVIAGLAVVGMSFAAQTMHRVLYNLDLGGELSASASLDWRLALAVPCLGGLAVGLFGLAAGWLVPRRAIDPVEANALYGGNMSLGDSLVVVAQTVLSNGVGASVGLEAGYAQAGSAVASRLGRSFRVRRADLRMLVGCGAAGAIGAAFNAPLTGAFYAYELIIGTYSLATLPPVAVSAICAVGTMRLMVGGVGGFDIRVPTAIEAVDYVPILALGMVCALGGIGLMRLVTKTEELFRWSRLPAWLRPAIGGLAIGAMALITPAVLSSGHSALRADLEAPFTVTQLALLIALKALASSISIGSGFRGGLFFASLFLGALTGKLFAGMLAAVTAVQALPAIVCALVGMSSFATAVVGGPLTMAFLALESTGSLPMTAAVLAAAVVSSVTVRRTFGYSFATWRFHLRGEAIRSAHDVGWVRNLSVGRMMRREFPSIPVDQTLAQFRREFPLGSQTRVIARDAKDRYAGIVTVSDAHAAPETATRVADVVHHPKTVLLPQMSIKEAVAVFEAAESDALAVVDGAETSRTIGVLTESYALRRYAEELDKRRRELSGE
jgi:CIC family chloride channel protein